MTNNNARRNTTAQYHFQAIADDLLARIRNGEWSKGERLPTVEDLATRYGHSRATVNKALQQLASQGYLSIRRGSGIHVLETQPIERIGLLLGESLIAPRQGPFAAVLAQEAHSYFQEQGFTYRLYVEDPALLPEGVPSRELREDLARGYLNGLITAQCDAPKTLRMSSLWRKHSVPLVDIGGHAFLTHRVYLDTESIYRLAMREANERQRTRMAILSYGPLDHAALHAAADEYGITIRSDWICYNQQGLSNEESGFVNMLGLWQAHELPNSVLILDDAMAKGAAQAMLKLHLTLPHELLPFALTNRNSGMFFPVPLLQLELDLQTCIKEATALLQMLIVDRDLPPCIRHIPVQLRLENGQVSNSPA